jgi:hypothetical protein
MYKLNIVYQRRHNNNISNNFDDSSDEELNNEWIVGLNLYFDSCLKPNKTNCKYNPSVHIHYADMRVGYYSDSTMVTPDLLYYSMDGDFITLLMLITNYLKTLDKPIPQQNLIDIYNTNIQEFQSLVYNLILNAEGIISDLYFGNIDLIDALDIYTQHIKLITSNNESSFIQQVYLNKLLQIKDTAVIRNGKLMTRTAAEYQKLVQLNPFIANKLREFVITTIKSYVNEFLTNDNNKMLSSINYQINIQDVLFVFMDVFTVSNYKMVPLSAFNMDIYMLSRIFNQYYLRQDEITNRNYEVFIYAGYAHNANYSKFLRHYLNCELLFIFEESWDDRCIFLDYNEMDILEGIFDPYLYRDNYLRYHSS